MARGGVRLKEVEAAPEPCAQHCRVPSSSPPALGTPNLTESTHQMFSLTAKGSRVVMEGESLTGLHKATSSSFKSHMLQCGVRCQIITRQQNIKYFQNDRAIFHTDKWEVSSVEQSSGLYPPGLIFASLYEAMEAGARSRQRWSFSTRARLSTTLLYLMGV